MTAPMSMRIYTVSDLHVDYQENLDWVMSLAQQDFREDRLIVAGDLTDDIDLLSEVLSALRNTFAAVHFIPGNHELWVDKGGYDCSLSKFEAVLDASRELGVYVEPYHDERLSIIPLFSWYDFSFGEPDIYLKRAWRDFRACKWPENLATMEAISDYFLEKNLENLNSTNNYVISFSHFLPRIDVMPERIPEKHRVVYPVLGSDKLGKQVEQLSPDVHIYGHSHVNRQIDLGKVSYVNNAFAYPSEDRIARKKLYRVMKF